MPECTYFLITGWILYVCVCVNQTDRESQFTRGQFMICSNAAESLAEQKERAFQNLA